MFTIIILAVMALIVLGAFGVSLLSRGGPDEVSFGVPVGLFVAALVATLFMSITTVDARSVGIQTAFGKYQGTLQPGLQLVAPWSSTEEFTTRLQPTDPKDKETVTVTFEGGGRGKVSAVPRWAISSNAGEQGAKALWESYRNFETVQTSLVDREFRDALLNVANDYTPNDARTKQDEIGGKVKDVLAGKLSRYGIVVDGVSVLSIDLDERTQASLDKIVAAQNDVERAKAEKERARIDNETAELRAKSGALSEGSLARYCLEVVNSWDVTKNGQLPATFNCGMGATDTPVIVGGGK